MSIGLRLSVFVLASAILLCAGAASAQYPILDMIANKVIEKYQNSTCEQLWQKKGQPPTEQEKRAIKILRDNPGMRAAFINKVAAPIANKMFECGLIP